MLVEEGPERIRELASWGARFDREEGRFHFTREGAHSRNRVLHALGDATGWEMVRALLEKTQRTRGDRGPLLRLLDRPGHGGRPRRRLPLPGPRTGAETLVLARATLLATGGAGQVFARDHEPAGGHG